MLLCKMSYKIIVRSTDLKSLVLNLIDWMIEMPDLSGIRSARL